MTEKRFSVECDDADIWEDNHFLAVAYDHHNALKFAERLNELAEENEQLKKQREELFYRERDAKNEWRTFKKENEQLKQSIQEYKAILQDMGMLMSDEDVVNIRNDIADKLLKPLFKSNGFDVDIDTTDGFTIIPKGDVE